DVTLTGTLSSPGFYIRGDGACVPAGEIIECDEGTLAPGETRVRRLVMTSPLQGNVSGGQIVTSSAGGRVQRRCSLLFSSCLSFDFLAATTLAEPEVDAGAETTWTINVENRHPFRSTA